MFVKYLEDQNEHVRDYLAYMNNTFSDLFKDVNGSRPKSRYYYFATQAEYDDMRKSLQRELKVQMAEEQERAERACEAYLERISELIAIGAKTPLDALRWLIQDVNMYDRYDVWVFLSELGIENTPLGKRVRENIFKLKPSIRR